MQTFSAFLEFCYIARQEFITEEALHELEEALERFHKSRTIFETSGVRPDGFHLPRQHALVHYPSLIRSFGAPNGLSTSITECQHIRSVKEPWRRSNRNNPLGQILVTNARTCKLVAAGNDFKGRGMLATPLVNGALTAFSRFESLN